MEKKRERKSSTPAKTKAPSKASPKKKSPKKPRYSEQAEQIKFFDWIRAQNDWRMGLVFAIPNEGKMPIYTRMRMKRAGVLPGVPDIFLAYANKGYHGLFIEMKVKPNSVKEAQQLVMLELNKRSYKSILCWSAEDAIEAIKAYVQE